MSDAKGQDSGLNGTDIIRYDLSFSGCSPALNNTRSSGGKPTGPTTPSREILDDGIEWESQVDEADKLDYVIAASSGVISGLIDAFFVGELSFDRASEWGTEHVNRIVIEVAQAAGYEGDDLEGAIRLLEKKCPFAPDNVADEFGGGLQHHFRDFSHHFSIGGLFCSLFTQFTGLVIGADIVGSLKVIPVPESHRQFLGENIPEKLAFGTIGWFFHMVSDMAGSSGAPGGGTGIPGPLLSFMKRVSALPFFKSADSDEMDFRKWLSKLFNGTQLADHDESGRIIKSAARRFDLRTEIGLAHELSRQIIPVLINQCIVRGFYLCRRVCREIRNLDIRHVSELGKIAPEDILPYGTPAMRRMITIASGVFTGVDLADATVRALFAGGNPVEFFLRVNYVGIGTFVVSCVVDVRTAPAEKELEKGEDSERVFERELSELVSLKLDISQARVLHSIERELVFYDVDAEEPLTRRARKKKWLRAWEGKVLAAVGSAWRSEDEYFLESSELYVELEHQIDKSRSETWLWLAIIETLCFDVYAPFGSEEDKSYKGLKLSTDYLVDVFCSHQGKIHRGNVSYLRKALDRERDQLDGVWRKRIAGTVGAVAITAASGGLAFYFAPALAPALAGVLGAEMGSLSGAALTSASLAFLGGGALAAGGAGMAGGAALIAGGGAVIGALGSSGVSTIATLALATDGRYVLDECAKLVAFSKDVLIERFGDTAEVLRIQRALAGRILEFEVQIEAVRCGMDTGAESDDKDSQAVDGRKGLDSGKTVKVLKRALKYLRKANDELERALRS